MALETTGEAGLIACPRQHVLKDWIDYNGHLNVAFYSLLFDRSLDYFFDHLGIGEDYARSGVGSCFVLESHLGYLGEVVLDDPIDNTLHLIDFDTKRLHYFMEMRHGTEGYLAATCEQLSMHVDMRTRRSAPFPDAVLAELEAVRDGQKDLPRPERVGAPIAIRRQA